jgi:hypothetical protein
VDVPWCVVGGWAIDLFLGTTTRSHDDLEIAVPRPGFGAIRARLHDCVHHAVGDGEVRRLDDDALPPPHRHQVWVLDPRANEWRVDVMLEPGDDETWVFRRDARVRAVLADVRSVRDGVPYLAPEAVLLFKAKYLRAKDEADFAACRPHMTAGARGWLAAALSIVHPSHRWIAQLGGSSGADG